MALLIRASILSACTWTMLSVLTSELHTMVAGLSGSGAQVRQLMQRDAPSICAGGLGIQTYGSGRLRVWYVQLTYQNVNASLLQAHKSQ